MDDALRGLTGEAFTLTVGPDSQQLTVPRGLLDNIPYFQAALKGGFQESSTKQFTIPEFSATAVANIIFSAMAGNIELLTRDSATRTNLDFVKAYIVADAWGVDDIANLLADKLVDCYDNQLIHPEILDVLQKAELRESPLYLFFLHQIAFDCLGGDYHHTKELREQKNLQAVCKILSSEDMSIILSVISEVQLEIPKKQTPYLAKKQCSWHKHTNKNDVKCQHAPTNSSAAKTEQGFWFAHPTIRN